MKHDNKPEAPQGYELIWGNDIPGVVPPASMVWDDSHPNPGWKPSDNVWSVAASYSWYAVPNQRPPEDPKASQSIAQEAAAVVAGDRAADYGDVNESFARIAKLWSAYTSSNISPWDVAQMMILLKVSRAKTSTKRDTLVDIIGYAECAERLGKTNT